MDKKVYYIMAFDYLLLMGIFLTFYPRLTERVLDKNLFIEILIICLATAIGSGLYVDRVIFKSKKETSGNNT